MRRKREPEKKDPGAPRWIPAYASLNTILLAFFITMSVNMGSHRALGYMGPGLGAFREAFTSNGLPSVLSGARRIINMFTWGGKYVPEEASEGEEKPWFETRLTDPPKRDLTNLPTETEHANTEIRFPLPIHDSRAFGREDQERLAAAARLIRLSGRPVLVCATVPPGEGPAETAWRAATTWSMRVARYLNEKEDIPAGRITAVGCVADPALGAQSSAGPSMTILLRPRQDEAEEAGSMLRKPQVDYQMMRQKGR